MAYCKSCGAYIPDGQTVCLACGYDEAAEQKKASGASAASAAAESKSSARKAKQQADSEFLRKQLEEQRRRQQENSRKWAETEFAQRQKAKEQNRSFADETDRSASRYHETVRNTARAQDSSKLFAGMSYFSFLFVLPYLFKSDDKFATYHAKQGMNLFVASIIGDIAGGLLGVGWLVTLARLYMIFRGVGNVMKDKKEPLPYIGDIIK